MLTLLISVHSFVDVITNSSSEIFVTANEKTVALVKELINFHLKDAHYAETADELFDVKLVFKGYDDNTGAEIEQSEYSPSKIRITTKSSVENPRLIELAKILNKLNSLFTTETFMT